MDIRTSMKTVSINIPVYYNETSLPVLFERLTSIEQSLLEKRCKVQLIFVDDGSGDESFNELIKIKTRRPETKIIKHSRNFGAIRAEKTGYRYVTGDCFCTLSADLQDPPVLVEQMVDKWLEEVNLSCASVPSVRIHIISRLFSGIYYKLIRTFVSRDYPKGGFDLILMDKVFLPYVLHCGKNINTSLFAYSLGFNRKRFIIIARSENMETRSWTFAKKFNYFIDSILGFSIIPLQMISWIGIVLALFSFIYGLFVATSVIFGGREVPGFAALFSLTSFLSGLTLTMLGIIGQYIWRIFDQINGTPESVVDLELLD